MIRPRRTQGTRASFSRRRRVLSGAESAEGDHVYAIVAGVGEGRAGDDGEGGRFSGDAVGEAGEGVGGLVDLGLAEFDLDADPGAIAVLQDVVDFETTFGFAVVEA